MSGEAAARQADASLDGLVEVLDVDVDVDLLTQALTHRSWAYEHGGAPDNERLELLGDAVLQLAVTERLYAEHPDEREGRLATLRAGVVNTRALAAAARALGLGAYLRLGRGEDRTGGRDKDSVLADAYEAVLGAVHLSAGREAAAGLVLRTAGLALGTAAARTAGTDHKTVLLEAAAARGSAVAYRTTGEGPDHDRHFTAEVLLDEQAVAVGQGRTKKVAEQEAARAAVSALQS